MKRKLFALLLVATVAGCVRPVDDRPLSPSGFVGAEMPAPRRLPDLTFIDTKGQPYNLTERAAGKMVLLFFGYTNCPDICPVHLANLAAVLKKLPDDVTRDILVVFITTDPARDSLPLLERWVTGFHPSFIALSGSDSVIQAAQDQAGVGIAAVDSAGKKGVYQVGHSAAVIGYTKDGMGRVEFPSGTRQKDWAHDIPLLVTFKGP